MQSKHPGTHAAYAHDQQVVKVIRTASEGPTNFSAAHDDRAL